MAESLSKKVSERNDNFQLLRFLAASMVVIGHSFILSSGQYFSDPLSQSRHFALGELAVNVFFFTSGFLVIGSLFRNKSVLAFVWARVLRIYPALAVAVLFSVFIVGACFSSLPIQEYLVNPDVWNYLFRNIILVSPQIPALLPGVFEGNPMPTPLVNGSL